jgi:hypothetical protein
MQIPRGTIDWIVDRFNVNATDTEIRADIELRIKKYGSIGWTPDNVKAATDYAVKRHHGNQALYQMIATGNIH